MANDKISPEERLFKVIQEGKKSPSPNVNPKKKNISLRGVKQFFANLKPKAKGVKQPKEAKPPFALSARLQEIDIKVINRALAVMLVILTVAAIHFAVNKRPNIAKITNAVARSKYRIVRKRIIETFKPVAFYLAQIRKRDIFKPSPRVQQKIVTTPRAKKAQAKLKELVKDLKLVGISWGKFPMAMIRSEKEHNTYFLRQGQMIGTTGIEVKTIFRDKVVISYQGEEMELL